MNADRSAGTPFVETPEGERFFVNAVLTAPALLALWPVLVRGLLRALGLLDGPSPLWDPIPALAGQAGPYIAWVSVIPLWTCWKNLRMELPTPVRWTLCGFEAIHAGVLGWWLYTIATR